MSGIASPPRGVWQYETSDSGRWLSLFVLGTFASFDAVLPHLVSPSRRTIARRSGQTLAAVRDQLPKLIADGVLEQRGRSWLITASPEPWGLDQRAPAAPPLELLEHTLDAGVKRCAIGLWSFSGYGDGAPIVDPSRVDLAERTGQSVRAVRKQLRMLYSLGLGQREGGGVKLTRPLRSHPRPLRSQDRPPGSQGGPAPTVAPSAPTVEGSAPRVAPARPPGSHHTLLNLAIPCIHGSEEPAPLPLFAAGAGMDAPDAADIAKMAAHPRGEQVRALWDEYNALRVAAAKTHGRRCQPLGLTPARASAVAMAIREHGYEPVLVALRRRGEGWASSLDSWERYSLHMWTERSVAAAITSGSAKPAARRGAGQGAASRLLGLDDDP